MLQKPEICHSLHYQVIKQYLDASEIIVVLSLPVAKKAPAPRVSSKEVFQSTGPRLSRETKSTNIPSECPSENQTCGRFKNR
eukprot:29053_3